MYRKGVYIGLIAAAITLYLVALFQLYILVSNIQNTVIPALENLSSMRLNYRVQSLNISRVDNTHIVSACLLVNITWSKNLSYRGPQIELIHKGVKIGVINITSYDKPVINKRLCFKLNISGDPGKILLIIHSYSGYINFDYTQPIVNASSIASYAKIQIVELKTVSEGNISTIIVTTKSSFPIKASVRIVLRDENNNVLASRVFEDYNTSSTKPYTCRITTTPDIANKTKYIEFYIEKILISRYRIGG